ATAVQEHYLAKRYQEAEAALPQDFLERIGLLGTVDRIADRIREYADAGVTTINLALYSNPGAGPSVLRSAIEALEKSGVAEYWRPGSKRSSSA
ncbi:MAG TPA: LLM class flavin-dependent oxidoreductase, partial [Sporichthya sp.]|nr:LLM class flavin-dependent oxidoreductase [Sporichthya sp.]